MLKQSHKLGFHSRMTNVQLPTRSFRSNDIEQMHNTTAFLTRTQQNGFLHIKVNAQNGTENFPKEGSAIQEETLTGSTPVAGPTLPSFPYNVYITFYYIGEAFQLYWTIISICFDLVFTCQVCLHFLHFLSNMFLKYLVHSIWYL
jgi:hypothetical protein